MDLMNRLRGLHRPALLAQAARCGEAFYRRETQLPRALCRYDCPPPAKALAQLLDAEDEMEELRRGRAEGYSLRRHVDLLVAVRAEARLLMEAAPSAVADAA